VPIGLKRYYGSLELHFITCSSGASMTSTWSGHKRIERLRYMHRNPVRRGLVLEPDQWSWSSFRFYACREPGRVLITHPDRPSSKYGVQRPDLVEVRGTHPFAKNAKGWGTLGEGWGTLCYVDAARKGGPPAKERERMGHPMLC
jgi:hypothetical protein